MQSPRRLNHRWWSAVKPLRQGYGGRLEPAQIALIRNHLARENVDVERDDLEARLPDFDVVPAGRERERRLIRRELADRAHVLPIDVDTGFRRLDLKAETPAAPTADAAVPGTG